MSGQDGAQAEKSKEKVPMLDPGSVNLRVATFQPGAAVGCFYSVFGGACLLISLRNKTFPKMLNRKIYRVCAPLYICAKKNFF